MDHHDNPSDNDDGQLYQTETFVFTGNGGPALLATMQNLMNRMMHGQQQQPQQPQQPAQSEQSGQSEQQIQPEQSPHPHSEDDADMVMPGADDPPVPDLPPANDENMPPSEPLSNDGAPSGSRPIRPLPRPHAHFHAHTPGGIIDLFTFNVGVLPPGPPPGAATFTFNVGPDVFAGFEAFFLGGMQKDREPDPERAKVLLKGMEAVPEGLVRRLGRACGVPGGQGSEDGAGCAVCWGPLLDEVDPGEWDTSKEQEDKAKLDADDQENGGADNNGPHGRIVALPCAHVYHADCLLPWFSRNTTCPMCRFDVDPESLTWTPRPPATEPPPPPPPANDTPPGNPSEYLPPLFDPLDTPNGSTDPHRQTNAAQAARFNAFVNTILRGMPFPQQQPNQPVPQTQHQEQAQYPPQPQPQPQPQAYPQPQPQAHPQEQAHPQPLNLNEPPTFGPAPPPPPPPNSFVLPPLFRMPMPLFVVPQPAQPNASGDDANAPPPPPPPPPPHPPAFNFPNSPPNPRPHIHPLAFQWPSEDGLPNFPNIPPPHIHPHTSSPTSPPLRERKKWTPPEPVGKTLRQRVEEKERELGLRCDDMVCGVAPSDEDPTPIALQSASGTKRITIKAAYDGHGKACEHSFHSACLVTSARVAGVTGDEELLTEGGEEDAVQDDELQVACPVCRAVGSLRRVDWDEGVQASEAEMA